MSSIQYLVQMHVEPLIKMDWTDIFTKAIRSMASPDLINNLCQLQACIEINHPIEVIPTITVSSITAITSTITRTSSPLPQPSTGLQKEVILDRLPGFAMNPLTFFLILAVISLFAFIALFVAFMCQVRTTRWKHYLAVTRYGYEREFKAREIAHLDELAKRDLSVYQAVKTAERTTRDCTTQIQTLEDDLLDAQNLTAHLKVENTRLRQNGPALPYAESSTTDLTSQNAELVRDLQRITKEKDQLNDSLVEKNTKLSEVAILVEDLTKVNGDLKHYLDAKKRENKLLIEAGTHAAQKEKDLILQNTDVAAQLSTASNEVEQLQREVIHLTIEKENLVAKHTLSFEQLDKKYIDTAAEAYQLKQKVTDLEEKLSDADFEREELLIDIKDLNEAKQTLNEEYADLQQSLNHEITNKIANIARLEAERDTLVSHHVSSQQELTEQLNILTKSKNQLQASLDGLTEEKKSWLNTTTAKDNEIASLQAANSINNDDAKSLTQARRDLKYREKRVEGQVATLRANNAKLHDKVKQMDLDVAVACKELADKTSALAITQMNYDYVSGRYEEAKKTIEQLRSNHDNVTSAVLKQLAKDLGVTSSHIEMIECAKTRILTSKAISARVRAADKMFKLGAIRFKVTNDMRRERRHSVSAGETRMQVGETIPERSSHLMTALENDYLNTKAEATATISLPSEMPSLQEVRRSLNMGRLPFASKEVKFLMQNATTPTTDTIFLPKISANNSMVFRIPLELRDTYAALWASPTRFDVAALFYHRFRNLARKFANSQDGAIAILTKKYDNRLTGLYNQLNKYRINGKIQSSILDSALDGNQGLRNMISKAAKDSQEC